MDGQLALRITAYYLTAWNRLLVRTLLGYYISSCLTEFFHLRRKLMNFLPHTRRLIKWNLQTKLIKNVKAMWKPLYLPSLGEVSLVRNNNNNIETDLFSVCILNVLLLQYMTTERPRIEIFLLRRQVSSLNTGDMKGAIDCSLSWLSLPTLFRQVKNYSLVNLWLSNKVVYIART